MTPQPRWRWWLFLAALWLHWRTQWGWVDRLMTWACRFEWLGIDSRSFRRG